MRIVFFGTGAFAVPALEALAPHIVLVVSQPDRPSGRGMRLHASPLKQRAEALGLEVATPEKCRNPEFVERVRNQNADFLMVASYGQILPVSLLEAAQQGAINLHGSILPQWRGAAPIQRSIQAGETITGVTLMQMDRGMDTGDAITIETLNIGPLETTGELEPRLGALAGVMASQWAERLAAGDYQRTPQDPGGATHAPKVDRAETELRFDHPARSQFNTFRAFTPNPGTFLRTRFGQLRVGALALSEGTGTPGTVLATRPELVVAFGDGALSLLEVQLEGKKRVRGADLANGLRLKPGDNLQEGR